MKKTLLAIGVVLAFFLYFSFSKAALTTSPWRYDTVTGFMYPYPSVLSFIGIGTSTPSKTLTVAGDEYLTGSLFDSTLSSGTNGFVLQTTGTGIQWVATSTLGISGGGGATTTPGGLNTQVQYNNAGVFGGVSGATTNGTILSLTNALLGGATLTTSSVNGVTLTTGGSATTFLNGAGAYTTPAGTGITALTGDVTATGPGSVAATLATVNGNVGSFTCASLTANAKGLITAVSNGSCGSGGSGTVSTSTKETANYFPFWTTTNGSPALLAGTSTISQLNGNVGIGSTSPVSALSVAGDITATGSVNALNAFLTNTSTGGTSQAVQGLVSNLTWSGSVDNTVSALGGGVRNIFSVFNLSGHSVTRMSAVVGRTVTGLQTGVVSTTTDSIDFYAFPIVVHDNNYVINSYGMLVGGGALDPLGQVLNRYGVYVEDLVGGTNRFGFYQAGATDKNYFAGNTGFGTTSPTSLLSVAGTALITGTTTLSQLATAGGAFLAVTPTGQVITTTTPSGGGTNYWTLSGSNLFNNSGTNVGINSSTPGYPLSVVGSEYHNGGYYHFGTSTPIAQCNTVMGASTCLEFVGSDNSIGGTGIYVDNINSGSSAYGGITLLNSSVSNATTNYSGLFLNSPSYSDTSFGTSEAIPNLLQLGNSMGPISIQSFGSTTAASYINFYAASTTPGTGLSSAMEGMRLTPTGLGIGSTSPNYPLSVLGSAYIGSAGLPGPSLGTTFNTYTTDLNSNVVANSFQGSGSINTSGIVQDLQFSITDTGNNNVIGITGIQGVAAKSGTGTLGTITGINASPRATGGNAVTTMNGFVSQMRFNNASTTVTNAINYSATAASTGGVVTNSYGFKAVAQKIAGVTNGYGIGTDGTTDINYFMGSVGVGTLAPGAKLDVLGVAGVSPFRVSSSTSSALFEINQAGSALFNNQAGTSGFVLQSFGTGAPPQWVSTTTLGFPAGGGGGVSSVSNADGTLTISPTTGSVVASLALAHANTWTGLQQFNANASTTALTVSGNSYHSTASLTNFSGFGTTTPAFSNSTGTGQLAQIVAVGGAPSNRTGAYSESGSDPAIMAIAGGETGGNGVDSMGLYAYSNGLSSISASGSYGVYAENRGATSLSTAINAALYAKQDTTATAAQPNYALYSNGGYNYFAGNVGIGSTSPGANLSLQATPGPVTNTVLSVASSTTSFFTILGNGNVGVASTSPIFKFSVKGTVGATGLTTSAAVQQGLLCVSSTGEFINESVACVASAKRYKENINNLSVGLDELMQLQPITFTWKKDFLAGNASDPNQNGIQYSLIADDVQKIDPNLVSFTTATTTFEGKTYAPGTINGLADLNHWVALIVKSIQDLSNKQDVTNATQDARLDALEAQVNTLQSENGQLKHMCVMN